MALTHAGFDGKFGEADLARMMRATTLDAVGGQDDFAPYAGAGRSVNFAAGFATACGVGTLSTAVENLALPTPTGGQWHLLVRRIDWQPAGGTVSLLAIAHTTTAASPVPTAPPTTYPAGLKTTPGVQYDQLLGWAWVNSANTTVYVWDLRRYPEHMMPRDLGTVADLDGLARVSTIGRVLGDTLRATELPGCEFRWNGTGWEQVGSAVFSSDSARDTAYAKAGGAYRVNPASVWRSDKRWREEYFPAAMLLAPWNVAGFYPVEGPGLPISRVRRAIAGGVTQSVWTAIAWTVEDFTTINSIVDLAGSSARFVAPVTGLYRVSTICGLQGTIVTTAQQHSILRKNGADIAGSGGGGILATDIPAKAEDLVPMLAGDYVEGFIFQGSSGARNTAVNTWGQPRGLFEYVGPVLAAI